MERLTYTVKPVGYYTPSYSYSKHLKELIVSGKPKEKVRMVAEYAFGRKQATVELTPKQALELAGYLIQIAGLSLVDPIPDDE